MFLHFRHGLLEAGAPPRNRIRLTVLKQAVIFRESPGPQCQRIVFECHVLNKDRESPIACRPLSFCAP
jgi:hypothetical protein